MKLKKHYVMCIVYSVYVYRSSTFHYVPCNLKQPHNIVVTLNSLVVSNNSSLLNRYTHLLHRIYTWSLLATVGVSMISISILAVQVSLKRYRILEEHIVKDI